MSDYQYNLNGYSGEDGSGYNPYEKRRSGFRKGVLTGVLSTLLISFLVCGAIIGIGGIRQYVSGQDTTGKKSGSVMPGYGQEETAETTASTELADSRYGDIVTKMEEIQGYIDEYYLFDYDPQMVEDNIYYGMLYGLGDPYTYYYNEEDYAALEESYTGEYYGIGVLVSQDPETGLVSVLRVYDGPAKEAGIQKGDILYRVEDLIVSQEDLNVVVAQIRGEEGTTVTIEIYRETTAEYIELEVERRQVIAENVEYRMLDGQMGYILLDQFAGQGASQLQEAMDALEAQGMEGLILDLRDNPGGELQVLLDIADIFLPRAVVLTIEDVKGYSVPYYAGSGQWGKPLVVLVNENSASAAEALSGALKDHGATTIVGTQTFGKGIVQTIFELEDGKTGMQLTTAHYYTPGGTCIHGTGITPDVVVEAGDGGTDVQLEKAVEVLGEMMK